MTHVIITDGATSSRAWEQNIHRALRAPRPVDLPLHVHDIVLSGTVEEGQFTSRWARAALADALLPVCAGAAHDMGAALLL